MAEIFDLTSSHLSHFDTLGHGELSHPPSGPQHSNNHILPSSPPVGCRVPAHLSTCAHPTL